MKKITIKTKGRTIEEIRKQITKEPNNQTDIFDRIVGQITLDDVIKSLEEGIK